MARTYQVHLEDGNWVAQGVSKDGNIRTLSWTSPDGAVKQLHELLEEELRVVEKVTSDYVLPTEWDFDQVMRIWLLGLASAEFEPFRWEDGIPDPPFLTAKGRDAADFGRNRKFLVKEWEDLFGRPTNHPEHPRFPASEFRDIVWNASKYATNRARHHEYELTNRDYELRAAEVWWRGKLCAMKQGTGNNLPTGVPWTPGRYAWDRF